MVKWNWRAMNVANDSIIAQAHNFGSYNDAWLAAVDHMKAYPANQFYIEVYSDESTTPPPPGSPGAPGVGGDRGGGDSGKTTDPPPAPLDVQNIDWQTWAAIATIAGLIITIIALVLMGRKG